MKVIEAFVTILDPRVTNSVGFSCPSIFSDSHFNLLNSKIIVECFYKMTRTIIIITRITRTGLTVESDDVSLVHGRRPSKYLDQVARFLFNNFLADCKLSLPVVRYHLVGQSLASVGLLNTLDTELSFLVY